MSSVLKRERNDRNIFGKVLSGEIERNFKYLFEHRCPSNPSKNGDLAWIPNKVLSIAPVSLSRTRISMGLIKNTPENILFVGKYIRFTSNNTGLCTKRVFLFFIFFKGSSPRSFKIYTRDRNAGSDSGHIFFFFSFK